ncbi:MAG: hypothetical protein Q8Q50_08575 [Methylobacter sp.]|jgi:hypothetical protein|nr:hypothetical protein [Methylobacter sp.]
MKACEPWLKALLMKMLSSVKNASTLRRILVVDGSSLQGTDYRLYRVLNLLGMTLHEVHVTGSSQMKV